MTLSLTIGDTLSWIMDFPVMTPDGQRADLTGWAIEAQIRNYAGAVIAEIACSWIDPLQNTLLIEHFPTAGWPVTSATLGVRLTAPSGHRVSSPMFPILLKAGLTDG